MSKRKTENDLGTVEYAGVPPTLYDQAVELLHAEQPDLEAIAEVERQLDEARPREMAHALILDVQADRELAATIKAGEGKSAEALRLERAAAMLKHKQPENAEVAVQMVAEIEKLTTDQHRAWIFGNDAANAEVIRNGLHNGIPRLFGLPLDTRSNPGNIAPEMGNFLRSVGIDELVSRDGWLFSKLQPAPPAPRRRLRTVK